MDEKTETYERAKRAYRRRYLLTVEVSNSHWVMVSVLLFAISIHCCTISETLKRIEAKLPPRTEQLR